MSRGPCAECGYALGVHVLRIAGTSASGPVFEWCCPRRSGLPGSVYREDPAWAAAYEQTLAGQERFRAAWGRMLAAVAAAFDGVRR